VAGESIRTVVYLAGQMSGLPNYGAPIFDAAAADLRQRGYRVINPVDIDREIGFDPMTDLPEDFDLKAAIRRDVNHLVDCDAIAMLPGHEKSKGAAAERYVAIWAGLRVLAYPSMVPLAELATALGEPNEAEWPVTCQPSLELADDTIIVSSFMQQEMDRTFAPQPPNEAKRFSEPAGRRLVPDLTRQAWIEALQAASNHTVPDGSLDDDGRFIPAGAEIVGRSEPFPEHSAIENATAPKDGDTVVNQRGGKQSHLSARFDCIPPEVLRLLAQCLGFGAAKYGKGNHLKIDQDDHLAHAMNHINEYRIGDRSEPHLVNAMARLTFALAQAVESGNQPSRYVHPEMLQHG